MTYRLIVNYPNLWEFWYMAAIWRKGVLEMFVRAEFVLVTSSVWEALRKAWRKLALDTEVRCTWRKGWSLILVLFVCCILNAQVVQIGTTTQPQLLRALVICPVQGLVICLISTCPACKGRSRAPSCTCDEPIAGWYHAPALKPYGVVFYLFLNVAFARC